MKTKSILWLGAGLFLLLLTNKVFSQDEKTLPPVTVTTTTNISNAVTKSFDASFKDASNAQWYKLNRKYLVDFMSNDQKNKALFQQNGAIIYHLTYGVEKNLPDDVRKLVKSNYVEYDILNAINVQQDKRNIWVINVQNDKKLVVIRVEEGQMEEVYNYDRSL
jgi:hypothetical protein